MKNLPTIISSFVIFLFISCGSENVTNQNPGTGEEVIFSMDSFAINLTNGTLAIDTNVMISNAPEVRIAFSCTSNFDSTISTAFFRVTAIDSFNTFLDTVKRSTLELNYSYSFTVHGSSYFSIAIILQVNLTAFQPTYLRLLNVKFFKIH